MSVSANTSYDGGDFVFSTSAAVSGCESGWYMKATDPGYKAAVSTVLAAQAAGLQSWCTGIPRIFGVARQPDIIVAFSVVGVSS